MLNKHKHPCQPSPSASTRSLANSNGTVHGLHVTEGPKYRNMKHLECIAFNLTAHGWWNLRCFYGQQEGLGIGARSGGVIANKDVFWGLKPQLRVGSMLGALLEKKACEEQLKKLGSAE